MTYEYRIREMSAAIAHRSSQAAGLIAVLLLNPAAFADIYHCMQNGKSTYTDTPCDAGALPQTIAEPNSAPAPTKSSDLAHQYDMESAHDAAANKKADAVWLKNYTDTKTHDAFIRKAEVENRVVSGMTTDQVERILNLPTRVENAGGEHERWLYVNGRERRTVDFKEGLVSKDSSHTSVHH